MRLFDLPADDVPGVERAREALSARPALQAWVDEVADSLRAHLGRPSPPPPLPPRPGEEPELEAYLPVVAFAAALAATEEWSSARHVPPGVLAATMRDVGRMLRRNRVWFGAPGLGDELAGWLTRHLAGSLHEVGRLQFERVGLGMRTAAWLQAVGVSVAPGETVVNLHIPEGGSLAPQQVTESLRAARRFLRRCFPEDRLPVSVCYSWLLDPQLAEHLPPESNIVAFQRRFRIGPPLDEDGDASVRKFVFGNSAAPLDELPQRTLLQRVLVDHWRRGGHWHGHRGALR